jgi:hypothetical protein
MYKTIEVKIAYAVVIFVLAIPFFFPITATSVSPTTDEAVRAEARKEMDRLKEKYKVTELELRFGKGRGKEMGYLSLYGNLTSPGLEIKPKTPEDFDNIARAFLKEEKVLVGLGEGHELRLKRSVHISEDPDVKGVLVFYENYIDGIKYAGRTFTFNISKDGKIQVVAGKIGPVPGAMRSATKRCKEQCISEDEAKDIVIKDVEAFIANPDNIDYNPRGKEIPEWVRKPTASDDFKLFVIDEEPYVVWIGGGWAEISLPSTKKYSIDAFTGEIVKSWKAYNIN